MMRKVLAYGLVMLLMTATLAQADEVYATANGKKFHKEACMLIKNKKPQSIDKQDAVKKGLEPCKKCFKDELSKLESKEKK